MVTVDGLKYPKKPSPDFDSTTLTIGAWIAFQLPAVTSTDEAKRRAVLIRELGALMRGALELK